VVVDEVPSRSELLEKAHCRTIMFGIEEREQKVLDRQKGAELARSRPPSPTAKNAGIAIVHGFFVVGTPDETVEDMRATFGASRRRCASIPRLQPALRLPRDARLQEYARRGLVTISRLVQVFKCSRSSDLSAR